MCHPNVIVDLLKIKFSFVPRPPCFYLPFTFTIIHRSGRPVYTKTGKAWEHSSREWMRGGRREGPIFEYVTC